MTWDFTDDMPIYLQIMNCIRAEIAIGELCPGDKVPSVRELAMDAGVNPNTMQKALSELEREGVLCTKRTAGRFVSQSKTSIEGLKERMAKERMQNFMDEMKKLGYEQEEILELITQYIQKQK